MPNFIHIVYRDGASKAVNVEKIVMVSFEQGSAKITLENGETVSVENPEVQDELRRVVGLSPSPTGSTGVSRPAGGSGEVSGPARGP